MTILIVDDDAGIRQLLLLFLEHKGYTAKTAANGLEALNHLQPDQPLPMLILLDLMMPIMDGATFRHAQVLKVKHFCRRRSSNLPVIAARFRW